MKRKPQVGEIVLFRSNPDDNIAQSNYNKERIPAIVTRSWSEHCVNIKIIPDCGPMQDRTSVVHQSINRAGYNFIFMNEDELPPLPDPVNESTEEVKDASSFLKSNASQKAE